MVMKKQNELPLYSSRITNTYKEYLRKNYPEINIDKILTSAGMQRYEVEDPGHWFTQEQVDRFHEKVIEKTGNSNIAREVGQYVASAESIGAVKQYGLGLMNPLSVYLMVETFYRIMTRGADAKAKKLGPNKVAITVTPRETTDEKPYQCENRKGTFESLAKAFTGSFAHVKETECFHKGGNSCQYVIEWKKTPSMTWRFLRNYFALGTGLLSLASLFFLPMAIWTAFTLALVTSTLCIANYAQRIEKKELFNTIEAQGNAAKELVNEINIRHNNALVVQEIGQVTSTIIDIDRLVREAMGIVKRYLLYDRGMLMLADQENRKLYFHTGYGYGPDTERFLKNIEYPIDKAYGQDVIPATFLEQRPFLFNSISSQNEEDSPRSELFARIGTQSFICVPVIYEKTGLGVLVVDNEESKKHLTQSDMSLLMGIASQIAVGINNALSFQKIHENENALQRSHDELEKRVEERTAELETLNRELNMEIAERQLSEERLMASLKEKDVLLKEVHHRVKNNLQIISSLLDMSKRRAKHPETIDLLSEAHAKIFTMSLIHTQLYQSDRFDEINMGKYVRDLTTQLALFHSGDRNISLQIDSPEIYLSVTQAIPCAFIINEVILNAFKHAFKDRKTGTIAIALKQKNDDIICLSIKDNGVGIPEDVDIDKTETLGIKLVRNLVSKQLKGDFKISTDRGTEIDIEFKALTT